ncbi:MAG: glycosyltransferase family 9 protein [Cyclobacteriaceae bacterium]
MRILLSRTDSIGDVILTLPMAGVLRESLPDVQVDFLGRAYTKPVVEKCAFISNFYDWDQIQNQSIPADCIIHVFPKSAISRWAKKQRIPQRIGTSHRVFHWLSCNRLINLGRKNSDLHEAQLNLKLLAPLVKNNNLSLDQISSYYGWKPAQKPQSEFSHFFAHDKFNLLLHPKSQGSAKEWPLANYYHLAQQLSPSNTRVIVTGTEAEENLLKTECAELFELPNVVDATGAFTLSEYIDFIWHADGLVACSTGPLHIAAASGINCLGLYANTRPIHAGRWGPVGKKATFIESDAPQNSATLAGILVDEVLAIVQEWIGKDKR